MDGRTQDVLRSAFIESQDALLRAFPEPQEAVVTDGPTQDPNAVRRRLHERIDNDFVYHPPPNAATQERYAEIRLRARELAHFLADTVPVGRELSRAISDLEDCVMHANAGIARNPETEA